MLLGTLKRIWQAHFTVALLVGLVLGTCIGLAEGISTILSQGVLGRYNELVAWAILIDASAMVAVEFGLALVSGLVFCLARRVPLPRHLVPLQLGETVFILLLAQGLWSQGTLNPAPFFRNPLGVVLPPALVGLVLGEGLLALSWWTVEHARFLQRLRVRYWLVLESVVALIVIAFSFSR